MRNVIGATLVFAGLAGVLVGCGQPAEETSGTPAANEPAANEAAYALAAEPADGKNVIAAREQATDGDEVVVVGRIGGSESPWVDGRAAFSIVDPSLQACSDIPGDQCPTPWDYCCETDKLPGATALVKVVDDSGNLVKTDARELLDLKELQTVVVKGKAQQDESGNMTILASGIYVRK